MLRAKVSDGIHSKRKNSVEAILHVHNDGMAENRGRRELINKGAT
jgi:hypothetical protein